MLTHTKSDWSKLEITVMKKENEGKVPRIHLIKEFQIQH